MKELNIPQAAPIMVHASLTSIGEIHGGAETLLGALFCLSNKIIFPAFTNKTMIFPYTGPKEKSLTCRKGEVYYALLEMHHDDLPVVRTISILAEVFRKISNTPCSNHPILSFCGINTDTISEAQNFQKSLNPFDILCEQGGWLLLIGIDHTVYKSIQNGEQQTGRYGFIRRALSEEGVIECPGFPGCSDGFQKIVSFVEGITHFTKIENAFLYAFSAGFLTDIARTVIESDPTALICDRSDCLRCNTIRMLSCQKAQGKTSD